MPDKAIPMRTRPPVRRKAIIFGLTLAGLLAIMGVYLIANSGPPADDSPSVEAPTSRPEAGDMVEVLKTEFGSGRQIEVPRWEKGRQTLLLKADESHILEPGRFRLVRPRMWNYLKDGQTIYLEADAGEMLAPEAAGQTVNPKRAVLTGNVRLVIDRSNVPGRPPLAERPGDAATLRMSRVEFDDADNCIRTDSAVRLDSADADMDVRGLLLRWNPVDRVITLLELNTAAQVASEQPGPPGRMVIRRSAETLERDQRSGQLASGPDGAATQPADDAALPPDPARVQTYRLTFHKNVEMIQLADPQTPEAFDSKLFSDQTVALVVDFVDRRRRDQGGQAGSAPSAGQHAGDRPAPTPTTAPDQPAQVMLITWDGVLRMVPVDRSAEPGRPVTGRRQELLAEGQNVQLLQSDGKSASCLKLFYDNEEKVAELTGSRQRPARMDDPGRRQIECEHLRFEQRRDLAIVTGPGRMLARNREGGLPLAAGGEAQPDQLPAPVAALPPLDSKDPDVVSIRWTRQVMIQMARAARRESGGPAAVGDQMDLLAREGLLEATFRGQVSMRQPNAFDVEAEELIAWFMQPAEGVQANQVKSVRATGQRGPAGPFVRQVKITRWQTDAGQGPQISDIACNWLTLDMELAKDGSGATIPKRAVACDDVKVNHEGSLIAAERMELTFKRRQPAADAPPGRPTYDPDEVQAFGNITVANEQRGLSAGGDHLYSVLDTGKATLQGNPARVQLEDRLVTGPILEFDQNRQGLQVLGQGKVAFNSDRDLSGELSGQPVPVRASFIFGMVYDGIGDQAVLRGDVRAASPRSFFQADMLKLTLETPPAPASAPDAAPATRPATGPEDPLGQGLAGKRLKQLLAEGNVLARTSQTGEDGRRLRTRMEIRGQQVIVDNLEGKPSQMQANGAGRMLLEDYRPAPPRDGAQPAGGLAARAIRPSQTAFAWTRKMQFDPDTLQAAFDGTVRMVYRGPDALAVGPDGSISKTSEKLSILNCDRLDVQFVAAAPTSRPAGLDIAGQADSIDDVQWVLATGDVYLTEDNLTLLCRLLEYTKSSDTVIFDGGEGKKAQIFRTAPDGSRFQDVQAPRIRWDRTTGRIEPFEGAFIGSGAKPR